MLYASDGPTGPPTIQRNAEMIGVSEAARIFDVDRSTIQAWSNIFREHLSPGATPPKGTPRQFIGSDLQVFAFVSMYWEDNADVAYIEVGLNSGDHHDAPFEDVLSQFTPLFQELPNGVDETWHHGGLLTEGPLDQFELADSYKLAGDTLVDAALSTQESWELLHPILFNYRHAIELYLKDACNPAEQNHKLPPLLDKLAAQVEREYRTQLPEWFKSAVMSFSDVDPGSTAFRYGNPGLPENAGLGDAMWIDLPHMKRLMGWIADGFQRIRLAR
jgi:hypothetical protein